MGTAKFWSGLGLFTWGANSYGQLGQEHAEDLHEPRQADCALLEGGVCNLAGGGGHSAVVTESGDLLVCGQNHRGQLGLYHTSAVKTFHLCPSLGGLLVRQVSCGWDFTLILTGCGQVLACGSNTYGQLGLSALTGHTANPMRVQAIRDPVIGIAAGLRHALALSSMGQVFQWGLGLSSQAKRSLSPHPVPAHLTSREPYPVPDLDHVTPKKVTAGSAHCVCLTAGGDLFLWGSNKQGQLCSTEAFLAQPRHLDRAWLHGELVSDVWSGWTHLVARTGSGRIFTWGRGDYGQLGRPVPASDGTALQSGEPSRGRSSAIKSIPVEVKALAGATQVACGSEHSLAIVEGRLLSWGWNEHGMCGNAFREDVRQPQVVPALQETETLLIACGAGHSMALCAGRGGHADRLKTPGLD